MTYCVWRMRMQMAFMKVYIARRVQRGYEKKSPFSGCAPDPHAFINHCICDFDFMSPKRVLTTKEWKILELQLREGRISPQKREEFYSYEHSIYTLNSIGVVLSGLGMLAEGFLESRQASLYAGRIICLARERSQMALRGARTTHAYAAKIMRLLLDAKRDFPR